MRRMRVGGSASRTVATVTRGVAFFALTGVALGGVAGTIDWPIVGTLFGAVGGALLGAVVGCLDGLILTLFSSRSQSRWVARSISGIISLLAAVTSALLYYGPVDVPRPIEVALVAMGVLIGAFVGPLIMSGIEFGRDAAVASRLRRSGCFVAWGAAAGASAGAAVGLVIGLRSYLPTSPVAAVEGAIFGAASGVTLACITAGVVVLPRLRARR